MQPNKCATLAGASPRRADVGFDAGGTCFLIEDALADGAAEGIKAAVTALGFSRTGELYPPSYRDNDRLVYDDPSLAALLFTRLSHLLPATLHSGGRTLRLVGLNGRFRFCRYRDGQSFRVHQDGAHAESPRVRSRLTLQIYLDDATGFEGGRTRFYASRFGPETGSVTPSSGAAVVFDHALWHDGEAVSQGTKHVLRTDVLYEAQGEAHVEGHTGYVYAVVALGDGRLATSSRDCTVRISDAGTTTVLVGHDGSVVALAEPSRGALLSGSRDGTLRLWDVERRAARVLLQGPAAVLSIAVLGAEALAGLGDGTIRRVDLVSGDETARWVGHPGWVWALAALPGSRVTSGSEDGTVRLWDADSGECLVAASPGRGPVHALVAVAGSRVAAGFADGHVIVYEVDRGTLAPVQVIAAHDGEVYALAAHGDHLATGGEDGWARVVRVRDGARVAAFHHEGFVRGVAMLEDGLVASGGYDGRVCRWSGHPRE